MFCPYCGKEIPDESVFCPECGAHVAEEEQAQEQQNQEQQYQEMEYRNQTDQERDADRNSGRNSSPKHKSPLPWILIGVGAVCCAALVFFLIQSKGNSGGKQTAAVNETNTQAAADTANTENQVTAQTENTQTANTAAQTTNTQNEIANTETTENQTTTETAAAAPESPVSQKTLDEITSAFAWLPVDSYQDGQILSEKDMLRFTGDFLYSGQSQDDFPDCQADSSNTQMTEEQINRLVKGFFGYDLDTSGWTTMTQDSLMDWQNGTFTLNPADGDTNVPSASLMTYEETADTLTLYIVRGPLLLPDFATQKPQYMKVVMKPSGETVFGGWRLYSMEEETAEGSVASVKASSTLGSQQGNSYKASHLIDGDRATAWVEGKSGVGIGVTLTFKLDGTEELHGICIANGYQKNERSFTRNGKVTEITLTFSDGSTEDISLTKDEDNATDGFYGAYAFPSSDSFLEEMFIFKKPVNTDTVKITIRDAAAGTKYDDIGISEVSFY